HQDMALVADNGASVYLRDELVYRDLIDRDLYHEVLALATATEGSVPVLCAFDDAYVLERDRCHEDVVSIYYRSITYVESFEELDVDSNKISIYFPGWDSKQKNDEVYSPAFASRLYLTCAGNEWLDFMNIGVDKGSGIRHLAQHLGIDLSDIAAFGDTYNDIPMLDIVGHSYVMANAAEHMHDHGKFLAPSNNEAGVLTVIDHIVDAMGAQPEPVAANQAKR
ncbi:MAG: HAD-IIB family hydrolase, partial [Collinsella stercoris]